MSTLADHSQSGAGIVTMHDIIFTINHGPEGSDVDPLILEAVVQIVLARADEKATEGGAEEEHTSIAAPVHTLERYPSTCSPLSENASDSVSKAQAFVVSSSPSLTSSEDPLATPPRNKQGNPYWHLTQLPGNEDRAYWLLKPTYDDFWSSFDRQKIIDSSVVPTWPRTPQPSFPKSVPKTHQTPSAHQKDSANRDLAAHAVGVVRKKREYAQSKKWQPYRTPHAQAS